MKTSRDQNRIVHSVELRRYNQRKGLLNRLDCELELTNDPSRIDRIRWLMARVQNTEEVFTDLDVC